MRSKTLEISWHGTSPIFAADYQPWSAAQLRKVLPFPSSSSGSGSSGLEPPSTSTSASTSISGLPSTPSRKQKQQDVDGDVENLAPGTTSASTPVASSSSTSNNNAGDQATPTPGRGRTRVRAGSISVSGSARDVTPTPAQNPANVLASAGGFNASATRVYRLATAGADSCVRIWTVHPNVTHGPNINAATGLEIAPHPPRAVYAASLKRHTGAVNVVRWSPTGQYLASAGDDGTIIIWHQVESRADIATFGEDEEEEKAHEKEFWKEKRMIVATKQAIYDLAWSPDGKYIITGSTDNLAQVFSVVDGSCVHQIQDHSHFVQGVAWDPLNEYLATQSSDRSVQVHSVSHRNNTLTISPFVRDRAGRAGSHMNMEIRSSRPPSFSALRPSMGRRASTASEAGSVVTLASELPENSFPIQAASSSTPVPSTPLSNMNPPTNIPGSRRSSFSSAAANSPLLTATTGLRAGRSPSPAPLPAIRPSTSMPLTTQSMNQKLYRDELATNFFRRLTFAPDGSLLLTPAGQIEESIFPTPFIPDGGDRDKVPGPKSSDTSKPNDASKSTVYIYARSNLNRPPIAHLPGHQSTTVAVRFSPIFYELRNITGPPAEPKKIILDKKNPDPVQVSLIMPPPPPPSAAGATVKEKIGPVAGSSQPQQAGIFALPYRLMFAVAAQDSVLLYDTQQSGPIAIFKGLHYSAFTDVAWSPTGDSLLLTSSDGYCSIVVFDTAELGPLHATQQHHRQLQAIAQSHSTPALSGGTFSHPPSPAPSNSLPTPYTSSSRMERETSVSSTGFPSAPGSVSATPSPFITKAEPLKLPENRSASNGPREIYGLPTGNVPVSRPPSSVASSGIEEVSASEFKSKTEGKNGGSKDGSGGKRSAEDEVELVEGDSKQKKRRIDLTKGS